MTLDIVYTVLMEQTAKFKSANVNNSAVQSPNLMERDWKRIKFAKHSL